MGGDGRFVVRNDAVNERCGFPAVGSLTAVHRGRLLLAEFACFDCAFVDVSVVGVASAGHGDVEQVADSGLAEDGEAGVGGDSLGGVHGGRVAETDVLAEVVGVEENTGAVVEPFGTKEIALSVDPGDSPPVSVAHRRQRFRIRSGVEW